jgi:transposase
VFASEFDRRLFAVRLVDDGWSQTGAAQRVERSDRWLRKWLRRYEQHGVTGLRDESRAPKQRPTALDSATAAEILTIRQRLTDSEFGGIGAETIRFELFETSWDPLPSVSTIERVLRRGGVTRKTQQHRFRRSGSFPDISVPGCYQQIDWVGPRWVADAQRFSSINIVDIGGGGADAAQYPTQRIVNVAEFLTEQAWPRLGIPRHLSADNQFVLTTHKDNPWTLWVRICLAFGVEAIVTPPRELGWHNHIESFNNVFQQRTLGRHNYPNLEAFQAASRRFIDYWHRQRPHPRLSHTTHQTRHPGVLLQQHRNQLRHPPPGFSINNYRHQDGTIRIPLAAGRLTFLRRVEPGNTITIARSHWPLPDNSDLEGEIVVATILTRSAQLNIRHQGTLIARHRYPIGQTVIDPYHPPAPSGLYYHRTGTMS